MSEPTLVQVFGANATQTADDLIISKADLLAVGLIASANNNAESLLVAIIKKAAPILTAANRETNPDQSIVIGDYSETISTTFTGNVSQSFDQITVPVELYKARQAIAINPMSY